MQRRGTHNKLLKQMDNVQEKQLTEKEKIILVLNESIKIGKQKEFVYHSMFEKHREVSFIKKLNQTMEEKSKLLLNLDENSQIYQTIRDCAKLALRKLQDDKCYNYYSAELILKINSLEKCFTKRLKPIGIRIIDSIEKVKINEVKNIEEEKFQVVSNKQEIYIKGEITGEELSKQLKKQKEVQEALKTTFFE